MDQKYPRLLSRSMLFSLRLSRPERSPEPDTSVQGIQPRERYP